MQHHAAGLFFQHNDGGGQGGGVLPYLHPGRELRGLLVGNIGAHRHAVHLIDVAGRVHNAVGQLAVIGKEQKSLTVAVQAADGVHPFLHPGQQVGNAAPPQLIAQGGHIAAGLVHHDIAVLLLPGKVHPLAVHRYHIPVGVHTLAYFGLPPIDGHTALAHQLLGRPAAGHSRFTQRFLNTNWLHNFLLLSASLRSFSSVWRRSATLSYYNSAF